MLMSEQVARTRWCPMVRVDGDNRAFNTLSDGFEEYLQAACGSLCMSWREFHLSHIGRRPELASASASIAVRTSLPLRSWKRKFAC